MSKETLKDRIAFLLSLGKSISEIAQAVNRTKGEVLRIRWKLRRVHNDTENEARRLAADGYGWSDIRNMLDLSERDARAIVFGNAWVAEWERRTKEREAS